MHRHDAFPSPSPASDPLVASALRQSLRAGYRIADFRKDVLAGLVVGVVALPLAMALGVASGVRPENGLYTAIIAGGLIALLGGSHVQVSGPTAAFVVVLAPVANEFGLGGLCLASLLAGLMLAFAGAVRLGQFIEFVPQPVTTGFTAGIAVVIATLQIRDFLGLDIAEMPEHYVEKVGVLAGSLATIDFHDLATGALTLALLLTWPRFVRAIPAPVAALPIGAAFAIVLHHLLPDAHVETIGSRFHYTVGGVDFRGIPQVPPMLALPWTLPGPDGAPLTLSYDLLRALIPSAFAIAVLGGIESLLSAVVADGVTGRRHNPDGELFAQGVGNVVAPFFGGFAATGAIARTATNMRAGARSPIAAVVHSLFLLASVLVLAPLLGYLPMASLAALLLLVAWNMSDIKHVLHALRVAPRADVAVLLICFALTVLFDMVVSVTAGVLMAALLFMRRMAELSGAQLIDADHPSLKEPLPDRVLQYEIAGPLFFGAAQRAMGAIQAIGGGVNLVILDLRKVPMIDATGLVNLESALQRLRRAGIFVVIAGIQAAPLRVLARAGLHKHHDWLLVLRDYQEALTFARLTAGSDLQHLKAFAAEGNSSA